MQHCYQCKGKHVRSAVRLGICLNDVSLLAGVDGDASTAQCPPHMESINGSNRVTCEHCGAGPISRSWHHAAHARKQCLAAIGESEVSTACGINDALDEIGGRGDADLDDEIPHAGALLPHPLDSALASPLMSVT